MLRIYSKQTNELAIFYLLLIIQPLKLIKMKKTVNIYDFRNAFQNLRPNNFSYEGLTVLWEYFEEYENETNIDIDFDPIAICIDFMECTVLEALEEYNLNNIEELEDNTIVLPIPQTDRIIYLNY